jgi:hypothetical protein
LLCSSNWKNSSSVMKGGSAAAYVALGSATAYSFVSARSIPWSQRPIASRSPTGQLLAGSKVVTTVSKLFAPARLILRNAPDAEEVVCDLSTGPASRNQTVVRLPLALKSHSMSQSTPRPYSPPVDGLAFGRHRQVFARKPILEAR